MSFNGRFFRAFDPERSQGFSLLELMLVLCLTAILSAAATSTFSSWIDSSRAKSVRNQLLAMFSEARHQALTRANTVTVCKLESASCSSDLNFPITAFTDTDRDASLGANEEILHVLDAQIPSNVSLSWNRSSGYLRFWPSGGTGALTGSLSYCDANRPEHDFRLVVARTGRLRVDVKETRCP